MPGMAKSTSSRWKSRPLSDQAQAPLRRSPPLPPQKPLAVSMAEIVSRHSASSSTTRIATIQATVACCGSALSGPLRVRTGVDVCLVAARGKSTLTVVPLPIVLSIRTPPPDWLATP